MPMRVAVILTVAVGLLSLGAGVALATAGSPGGGWMETMNPVTWGGDALHGSMHGGDVDHDAMHDAMRESMPEDLRDECDAHHAAGAGSG